MMSQARVEELFAPVEGTSVRRMFGGFGIFRRGIMYGLVASDVLYLKADELTRATFEAEGCEQWVYDGKQRPVPMPYWRVPERLHDEPDEFREWALAAFAVAERTTKPKAPKPGRAARPAKSRPAVVKKRPAAKASGKKVASRRGSAKPAGRVRVNKDA